MMVIAQEPTQSLAALDGLLTLEAPVPRRAGRCPCPDGSAGHDNGRRIPLVPAARSAHRKGSPSTGTPASLTEPTLRSGLGDSGKVKMLNVRRRFSLSSARIAISKACLVISVTLPRLYLRPRSRPGRRGSCDQHDLGRPRHPAAWIDVGSGPTKTRPLAPSCFSWAPASDRRRMLCCNRHHFESDALDRAGHDRRIEIVP